MRVHSKMQCCGRTDEVAVKTVSLEAPQHKVERNMSASPGRLVHWNNAPKGPVPNVLRRVEVGVAEWPQAKQAKSSRALLLAASIAPALAALP